eukprot:COSAG01_NODE_1131_length_11572_cov_84.273337_13_plen_126_part_00
MPVNQPREERRLARVRLKASGATILASLSMGELLPLLRCCCLRDEGGGGMRSSGGRERKRGLLPDGPDTNDDDDVEPGTWSAIGVVSPGSEGTLQHKKYRKHHHHYGSITSCEAAAKRQTDVGRE